MRNQMYTSLDNGGYLLVEWPKDPNITIDELLDITQLFGLLVKKFRRKVKPSGVYMTVGKIELFCRIRR